MSQKKKISQQAKWLALLVSASDRRSVSNLKIQHSNHLDRAGSTHLTCI
ncbi:hypothetical protein [Microcoleus sp. B9-D4]